MSRFGDGFFDEDEHNFEYEDEYTDDSDHDALMGAAIPAELMNRWKQSEIDVELQKINFVVLKQATAMLEKSWFWRFSGLEKRVRMICDTYYAMIDLINISE